MDKQKWMEAMNYIDPDLIEAADVPLARPRKRWSRPALIAACLCLVLAGTAMASELAGVHISDFFKGRGMDSEGVERDSLGYDCRVSGIERIPIESLAPEVMEHIAETRNSDDYYSIITVVSAKKLAEEFLGLHLPDNPILDQACTGTMGVYAGDNADESLLPEYTTGTSGYISLSGWKDAPETIEVNLAYKFYSSERTEEIENGWVTYEVFMPVYVRATLFTDASHNAMEEPEYHGTHHIIQNEFAEHTAIGRFSYTTPDGLEATIMATSTSLISNTYREEPTTTYNYQAYFVLDGIFYEVQGSYYDADLALDTITEILDNFAYEAPEA